MKDEEAETTSTAAAKNEGSDGGLFRRSRYKFWALAAILLLAFWSMFTGSVTLKWSSGNLSHVSDDPDFPIQGDLDILELEEREKVVRQMWDVYTHSTTIRLPRFWLEAFEAAYDPLTSEVPHVRKAAISEIAKMSFRSIHSDSIDPTPFQPTIREAPSKVGKARRR